MIILLPNFFVILAEAFILGNNYNEILDRLCQDIGKISDDGDAWVDKHSGYILKLIEFDVSEGYETSGAKIISRDLLEQDLGSTILSEKEDDMFVSEDARTIINIVQSMQSFMGISIINQKEFIVKGVLNRLDSDIGSKEIFDKQMEVLKRRGKKIKD